MGVTDIRNHGVKTAMMLVVADALAGRHFLEAIKFILILA